MNLCYIIVQSLLILPAWMLKNSPATPIPRPPKASTRVGKLNLCEGDQPAPSLDAAGPRREGELLHPKDLQVAKDKRGRKGKNNQLSSKKQKGGKSKW